jgi:hypothetical protein
MCVCKFTTAPSLATVLTASSQLYRVFVTNERFAGECACLLPPHAISPIFSMQG